MYFAALKIHVPEDIAAYHADHLGEIILTLKDLLSGQLAGITFGDFVERGILGPARYGLSRLPNEEIGLSVLELEDQSQTFAMTYEVGHGVGRKQDFSLPKATIAGHAYDTQQLQRADDVEEDSRWQKHPKARPGREYGSLAAMPIVVSGSVVAVLNVISTEKRAFSQGDLTYIELLGTLIGLAWSTRRSPADQSNRLAPKEEDDPA